MAAADRDTADGRRLGFAQVLALTPLGVTGLAALWESSRAQLGRTAGDPLLRRALRVKALALLQLGLVALVAAWMAVFVPSQQRVKARAQYDVNCGQLRAIANACLRFRDGPGLGQRYPASLKELTDVGLIDAAQLKSPVDHRGGPVSYSYVGNLPPLVSLERFVLAYETYAYHRRHGEAGYLAVFADERVEWLSSEELQALIHEQKGGHDH